MSASRVTTIIPKGKFSIGKPVQLDTEDILKFGIKTLFISKNGYVQVSYQGRLLYLHRLVMGLVKGDGKEIDHLDNNPLNNTKSNLDICTRSTNMSKSHQREITTNKTGYKGVKISGTGYSSRIKITVGNKAHSLSRFCSIGGRS